MSRPGEPPGGRPNRRARQDLHIRSAADTGPLLGLRPRIGQLFVDAPALDEGERRDWQARLRHDLSQCGCHGGRTVGVLGLVAAAAYLGWAPLAQAPWRHSGAALGLVLGGLLLGQGLGLLRARLQLRRHVRRLQQRLDGPPRANA